MKFCKRIITLPLMCLIVFSSVMPTTVHASANSEISSEAREHILSQLRRTRIPNAAIAVIQNGGTSYILRDSDYESLFNIASVSKSFTGFGVLLLEDMGLLSVSDPVNTHLPWFEASDITIYNLLHHTSGFTNNRGRFPNPAVTETTGEFIERIRGVEPAFDPSTGYAYSNLNFILLGFIIEAVSGQSYDDFMTQYVLHPLGLYNTFTCIQSAHATGRVIGGHTRGFLRPRPDDRLSAHAHPANVPTGGMYSGIADLARWAGIHLGVVDIPEQFERVAQRSHMHHHGSDTPFANMNYFHAAGWVVDPGQGFIEHGGQNPGYSAIIRMYPFPFPQETVAVVVLSNMRYISIERLGMVALDAAVDGSFNRVGLELFEIIDTFSTIFIAMGIVYAALHVRLAIKVSRRLRSGERIKASFSSKIIAKFPFFPVAGLIFYYTFPYLLMDSTRASIVTNWPVSFVVAAAAVWIATLYDLFSWFVKVFVRE